MLSPHCALLDSRMRPQAKRRTALWAQPSHRNIRHALLHVAGRKRGATAYAPQVIRQLYAAEQPAFNGNALAAFVAADADYNVVCPTRRLAMQVRAANVRPCSIERATCCMRRAACAHRAMRNMQCAFVRPHSIAQDSQAGAACSRTHPAGT